LLPAEIGNFFLREKIISNFKFLISNEFRKMEYNLEERTTKFAEDIIDFIKSIKQTRINESIIVQLLRAGTSVGANYCEANGASSKKDFRNKICICRKEIQETKYWFKMIDKMMPELNIKTKKIWTEAQELTLIFAKIISTVDKNSL